MVKAAGAVAVALMVMVVAAMPAVACNCGTIDKVDGNGIVDNFIIENEHGFGKLETLVGVAADKDVISVIKDLHSKGYKLQYSRANIQKIRPKENESQEALLVIIPAESKNSHNSAQLIFASNGEMTCVANAIIEDGENYRRIEAYEINNGTEKNYVVENRAGTISIDGKTIITGSQIRSSTDCDICLSVCGVISAAGCGLSGFLVCTQHVQDSQDLRAQLSALGYGLCFVGILPPQTVIHAASHIANENFCAYDGIADMGILNHSDIHKTRKHKL